MSSAQPRPTRKQLAYLKSLAARTGATFAYPATRDQASAEIKRLLAATPTPASDRRRERAELQRDIAQRPQDATAIRPHEVTGYGSGAHWAHGRDTRDTGR